MVPGTPRRPHRSEPRLRSPTGHSSPALLGARASRGHRAARGSLVVHCASVLCLLLPGRALAQQTPELRFHPEVEVPVTVGLGTYWLGSELLKDILAPEPCRVCGTAAGIDGATRRALRWQNTSAAATASNVVAYGLVPGGALVGLLPMGDGWETRGQDVFFVLEAVTLSGALNQTTKFLVGRERPLISALVGGEKARSHQPSDNNLSFYSGHTSYAASLGAGAATVASLRDYESAPWLWALYGVGTVMTGYLRIAADRHYLSDVLVGALVGTAAGILLPLLLHGPEEANTVPAGGVAAAWVPSPGLKRPLSLFTLSGQF